MSDHTPERLTGAIITGEGRLRAAEHMRATLLGDDEVDRLVAEAEGVEPDEEDDDDDA